MQPTISPEPEMTKSYADEIEVCSEDRGTIVNIDSEMEKRLVRKMDRKLLPLLAVIYLLCYLDRGNIGNAKILNSSTRDDMMTTNHMTNYEFTVALMCFLVAYSIFEIPSNLVLKSMSPSRWISFLVVAFGAICAAIGGTKNFAGVAGLRFVLGAAEAGVFPGLIFYLSFWYKSEERATRIAAFLCSASLAGAFGGALAFGVGHMNGAGGLEGWRWLFILEGVVTVAVGLFCFWYLPNYPETCTWLTAEEKALSARRLGLTATEAEDKINWPDAKATLKTWSLWVHYVIYFGAGCAITSLSLFAPTIVAGLGYKDLHAQLFTIPPFAIAYIFTIGTAFLSDHYHSRGIIGGCGTIVGSLGFAISAALPSQSYTARYVVLIIATSGAFSALPALVAWVGDNLHNSTASSLATAINIAFSGPGQIIGIWVYRAQDKPFYRLGHAVNAGVLLLSSILCFVLTVHYRNLNKKLAGTNQRRYVS
ncbi:MFS transporter [Pyrenochaeta sp. DS3sAY3a]|nr:MFS transporter [Pyrenochaeta sp. DS3sAY3a]